MLHGRPQRAGIVDEVAALAERTINPGPRLAKKVIDYNLETAWPSHGIPARADRDGTVPPPRSPSSASAPLMNQRPQPRAQRELGELGKRNGHQGGQDRRPRRDPACDQWRRKTGH